MTKQNRANNIIKLNRPHSFYNNVLLVSSTHVRYLLLFFISYTIILCFWKLCRSIIIVFEKDNVMICNATLSSKNFLLGPIICLYWKLQNKILYKFYPKGAIFSNSIIFCILYLISYKLMFSGSLLYDNFNEFGMMNTTYTSY